jgi:hypothetical protein
MCSRWQTCFCRPISILWSWSLGTSNRDWRKSFLVERRCPHRRRSCPTMQDIAATMKAPAMATSRLAKVFSQNRPTRLSLFQADDQVSPNSSCSKTKTIPLGRERSLRPSGKLPGTALNSITRTGAINRTLRIHFIRLRSRRRYPRNDQRLH